MADNRDWTRDELLACFNFYCRTPFGKFHRNNPDIIRLAEALDRTPSAVAMKLGNFASFDPAHQSRNVKGLANASRLDRAVWEEFNANPNLLAQQSEEAYGRLELPSAVPAEVEFAMPTRPTEATATCPIRLSRASFAGACWQRTDTLVPSAESTYRQCSQQGTSSLGPQASNCADGRH
ncbi:MAG: hypothetical protein DMG60_22175 [Acidobacteria bacterium]|nr:MAG: hypothetical protein DMG60_22175 [Acidobacteriota bacterium]